MRFRTRPTTVALSLLAAISAQGQSAATPDSDQVLVALVIHTATDGPTATVTALRHGDVAMLPLAPFLALAEIAATRPADGVVDFVVEPAHTHYHIDAGRSTATRDRAPLFVSDSGLAIRDGEVLVESSLLASWLGIRFEINWNQLRFLVPDQHVLPVQRRADREAERQIVAPPSEQLIGEPVVPIRPKLDGLVVDYALTVPLDTNPRASAYALSAGMNLFGGALDGVVQSPGQQRSLTQLSWTGVWDNPLLAQVRLGSTSSVGLQQREMNGFAITNSPFIRPLPFGVVSYGAALAPGWEVESYLDGLLVGADSTDVHGHFSRTLPVDFGSNPVQFIAYGPHGEEQQFGQLFQVFPEDFLPARHVEYGLSAGQCVDPDCRATGDADLRFGVTSRLSAQGGLEWLRDSSGRGSAQPYVGAAAVPLNPLLLLAEWQSQEEATLSARWQPSVNQSLDVVMARLGDEFSDTVMSSVERRRTSALYYLQPPWLHQSTYLTLDLTQSIRFGSTLDEVRTTTGFSTPAGSLVPYLERDATDYGVGGVSTLNRVGMNFLLSSIPKLVSSGNGIAFGTVERASLGVWTGAVTYDRPVTQSTRIEGGLQWLPGAHGPLYTLRLLSDLPQARTITTASAANGHAQATQFIAGSMLADVPNRNVLFVPGPELLRAGIGGRVYLDQNVDGRFDEGDVPLVGVVVRVGNSYALTDSSGQYRVWDVTPFEPVAVAVDASTLENPLWVSDVQHAIIRPWPNRLQIFDVGIEPGGVLEGVVHDSRGPSGHPFAGVRLILREVGGPATLSASSFTDGTYSFIGVKPGRWELTIDSRDLEAIHGSADPVPVTVNAVENGDRVSADITVIPHVPAPHAAPWPPPEVPGTKGPPSPSSRPDELEPAPAPSSPAAPGVPPAPVTPAKAGKPGATGGQGGSSGVGGGPGGGSPLPS